MKLLNFIGNWSYYLVKRLSLIVALTSIIVEFTCYYPLYYKEKQYQSIYKLYYKLAAQTGMSDKIPPLIIMDTPEWNAFYDGEHIVLFTGLINEIHNWDELASVLGHEMAHATLEHIYMSDKGQIYSQEHEAVADKMGAVYMMKAGYSICKGREIWKRQLIEEGNTLNSDHPNYSYRYDELNINCD